MDLDHRFKTKFSLGDLVVILMLTPYNQKKSRVLFQGTRDGK
jgi:translation initiation factor IF-1